LVYHIGLTPGTHSRFATCSESRATNGSACHSDVARPEEQPHHGLDLPRPKPAKALAREPLLERIAGKKNGSLSRTIFPFCTRDGNRTRTAAMAPGFSYHYGFRHLQPRLPLWSGLSLHHDISVLDDRR